MVEVAASGDPKPDPPKKKFEENKQDIAPPPPTPKVPSQQVANTQLGLQGGPKGPASTRSAVDRAAHGEAMQGDRDRVAAAQAQRVQQMAAQARTDREKFNAAAQAKEQGKDNGMGR